MRGDNVDYIVKTYNLTKDFNNFRALDNVNITINKGDIYGLVGENGAGKSTLIRLISGLMIPTSGSIDLQNLGGFGSLSAIVESPALHPSCSAVMNLKLQCDLLGIKNCNDRIEKVLEIVGLQDLINNNKKVKHFSLGMKQRLAIAMALISNPKFIILDEPMNGLDPLGIMQMRELFIELNQNHNITFLISSHILSELDKVATKYGFISRGKLLLEISADEIHKSNKTIEEFYLGVIGGIQYAQHPKS